MPTPPLVIPPENIQRALEVAANGGMTNKIVEALGCGKSSYFRLRQNDPVFDRELQRARAIGRELIAEGLTTLVDEDPFGDPQLLRLKSENLKWFLGVQDPARYGQRQTVTVETVDISAGSGSQLPPARPR